MNFSKQLSSALISTAPGGARWRRWLAVSTLFVAVAAGLAVVPLRRTQAQSQPKAQVDTLHGAAALERLKQDGQYDSLQSAMEQARLTVSQTEQTPLGRAAWHAPNQAAGYDAFVTEAGVSIAINDKTYVSLHLQRLGYGQALQAVRPGAVSGDERTINIEREGGIQEWFVNSADGLEHGFTLSEPPGGRQQDVPLRLAMQVSKGWQAVASEDGKCITLRNDGAQAVEYSQLVVRDARGLNISAKLTVADEQVVIEIADHDAQYPLMIDPIFTLQQRLTAADGSGGDFFGHAVALSGNTALVGAPYDNQSRGSAYVFVRNGATWTQQARLFAQDGGAFDYFGQSVALKGDTVLVGAVYGPGNVSSDQGAAYVFFRVGTSWNLQQKLNANENTTGAQFGAAVALDGNTALVGAFSYGQSSPNGGGAGAAFVFTRSNTLVWTQQARLTVAEGEYDDYFGIAVALEGDTALIGAPRHAVTTAGQGAAYVFTRNGTSWTPQQRILNTNPEVNERFGNAVALSGENALIGAYFSGPDERGAAYSFRRGAAGWTQTGTLLAPNPKKDARLSISIALSGDTAVVGAARGLFDTGDDHHSAYVFVYSGEWLPVRQLGSELGAANDGFGYAVALEGETVLIGAYRTAVTAADQGAAYVLTLRDSRHAEQQKLIADDGKKNDYFGSAVALAGDTLVVAAVRTNNFSGAVYIFTRTGTPSEWQFQQKLTAADGVSGDNFGEAVALSGNTLLVGAPHSDARLANQGVVYAYRRTGAIWQLTDRAFTTSGADAAPNMYFGQSIALSGNLAVIGAPGVNKSRGAVFVFTRAGEGAAWKQEAKFTALDGTDDARLGDAVALADNTVVAGAPYDTINGNKDQGSVSLFDLTNRTRQLPKLLANDGTASQRFGYAVALRGDTLAVGAPNQGFNRQVSAAYVFRLENSRWVQRQKLATDDGATNNLFGQAVALSDGLLAIGSLAGRPGGRYNQGAVYIYGLAGQWQFQQKLLPSDTVFDDLFGSALAISGDTIAVGALGDTVGAQQDQGSAFVFNSPACPAITVTPDSLPSGTVGALYNQSLTASGGSVGEYHFAVTSGALPPGITLQGDQGLAGTPTAPGTYRFTIRATYYLSLCAGSREYTLTITSQCSALTLTPTLPNGVAGAAYNQTVKATGGAEPYHFALSSGALPPGVNLSASGSLSGMPTQAGIYNFTIAAESNGCTGAQAYTLAFRSSTVSAVSAASYKAEAAPESIVAVFGGQMTEQTQVATGLPLPTELAGLSVRIRDSQGVERLAPLFFVSPGQINLQIPAGTATGMATVKLSSGATGQLAITRAAASVFTANSDGRGVPAAVYLVVRNGVIGYEPVARFDGSRYVPEPVRFDFSSDQVFLVLYGTGLRLGREVTAKIGGLDANVAFAGAAPGFAGLDQVNIQVPFALRGRGELEVVLYVEQTPANTVLINVR